MELIPKGKYAARAEHWKLSETGAGTANAKEQIAVEFKFTDPALGTILWFGFFTELTFERTVESLRHMGWKGNDVSELNTPQADLNANEVQLVVDHEEYKGVTRAKVRWVNAIGGIAIVAPLGADKMPAFVQRMKGAILAMEQKAKASGAVPGSPPLPPPTPPSGKDADIPF